MPTLNDLIAEAREKGHFLVLHANASDGSAISWSSPDEIEAVLLTNESYAQHRTKPNDPTGTHWRVMDPALRLAELQQAVDRAETNVIQFQARVNAARVTS